MVLLDIVRNKEVIMSDKNKKLSDSAKVYAEISGNPNPTKEMTPEEVAELKKMLDKFYSGVK